MGHYQRLKNIFHMTIFGSCRKSTLIEGLSHRAKSVDPRANSSERRAISCLPRAHCSTPSNLSIPHFNFHTVMGGLLEKWGDGPVDPANGINGPADVAGHWREVGEQTRMPIDGTLMHDNPVQSSYPPSRVFKVIQKQDEALANVFLRRAREAVFAFNENISDQSVLVELVNNLGLDGEAVVNEAEQSNGQQLLNEDFRLAGSLGARG